MQEDGHEVGGRLMPQRAKQFVVIAEFEVPSERLGDFLEAAGDDARHSVADESGCLQFDVSVEQGDPARVVFYEVYESQKAFDAHLQTPHLARFRKALPLVSKEFPPRFLERAHPGGDT